MTAQQIQEAAEKKFPMESTGKWDELIGESSSIAYGDYVASVQALRSAYIDGATEQQQNHPVINRKMIKDIFDKHGFKAAFPVSIGEVIDEVVKVLSHNTAKGTDTQTQRKIDNNISQQREQC